MEFKICLLFGICNLGFSRAEREDGRGAFSLQWSQNASFDGAKRSENVGMSNRNASENGAHRKSKVSLAMDINQGLGDPNFATERLQGMDSRLIFRPFFINSEGVTKWSSLSGLLDFRSLPKKALLENP